MKYILLLVSVFLLTISCEKHKESKQAAKNYYLQENYELALKELNNLIKEEPDSLSHLGLRALTYGGLGMYHEKIKDLSKVIDFSKSKKLVFLHHERALAYFFIEDYTKALIDIDFVIKNKEGYHDVCQVYIQKASILYALNDLKNSSILYKKALKENNSIDATITSQALIGLSNITIDKEEAKNLLNRAIEADPENGLAYGARGVIYFENGELNKAKKDFHRAKIFDPKNTDIDFNLGQLYMDIPSKIDSAKFYFNKALKTSSQSLNNELILTNLGVIETRLGHFKKAENIFEKAERDYPHNDLLLFNYSFLLSDMGKNTEALNKLNIAMKINPNSSEYYHLKGSILIDLLSYNKAEEAFKKAINLNPKYGSAYYNLGYLNSKQKHVSEAIKYYDSAILLEFDLKASLVNRALLKIKLGKTQNACIDLSKAYQLGRVDIKPLIIEYCE